MVGFGVRALASAPVRVHPAAVPTPPRKLSRLTRTLRRVPGKATWAYTRRSSLFIPLHSHHSFTSRYPGFITLIVLFYFLVISCLISLSLRYSFDLCIRARPRPSPVPDIPLEPLLHHFLVQHIDPTTGHTHHPPSRQRDHPSVAQSLP